jgi:Raf kinase inhibitor-like YbhB/YbcL family protein
MKKILFTIVFFAILITACAPAPTATPTAVPTEAPTETPAPIASPLGTNTPGPSFTLSSPVFEHEGPVPKLYTCSGESISPPLTWTEPPAGTQSFALIADDPDAAGFIHWVIYNIPAASRGLPENVAKDQELPDGVYQGFSGGAVFGYVGLCPPNKHRYSFRLYALDLILEKKQGVGKKLLDAAMEGHILAQSELVGTFAP